MAGRLIVIKGYDRDRYLELKTACSYCIGRGGSGRNVDFKVDPCEYLTSRQHFFIDYIPPHFYIRDNNSTNGTLIQRGNATIPATGEQTEVYDGDRIVAGNTVFKLEATDEVYEIPVIISTGMENNTKTPVKHSAAPMESLSGADHFSRESIYPANTHPGPEDSLSIEDSDAPADSVSPASADAEPAEQKPLKPQDYYSVIVPEIQLFHSAQAKCIACGDPITVEITPSEQQAYGHPIFMCRKCSSDYGNEHSLKGLDSYCVLQELRQDGMGLVYLARHEETGLLAEIRVILPRLLGEDILYLKREISVMQTISHPNLVRMYENVVCRDRIYLIYEYMPEGDLECYLKATGGSLSWNDACRVVCDVLSGLRHCHEMGVVHGDIKPESILFKKDPRGIPSARLGDLGLAWICDNTGPGFVSGYREINAFKAPELIGASRVLTPVADIYSIGVLFYSLLTGSLPSSVRPEPLVRNGDIPAGASSSVVPLLERNSDVPRALIRIVEKAICPDPEKRFQNATEMLQAILEMRL